MGLDCSTTHRAALYLDQGRQQPWGIHSRQAGSSSGLLEACLLIEVVRWQIPRQACMTHLGQVTSS